MGGNVWPISANSWSMANELTYLRLNPDVVNGVDQIVFVTNSEDFVAPSVWRSEISHPTHQPLSACAYVVAKKLPSPQVHPKPAQHAAEWSGVIGHIDRPVFVVAYPTEAEAKSPELRRSKLLAPIRAVVGGDVKVLDVAADPRWTGVHYRDPIHPDPEGTAILAAIVSENLR